MGKWKITKFMRKGSFFRNGFFSQSDFKQRTDMVVPLLISQNFINFPLLKIVVSGFLPLSTSKNEVSIALCRKIETALVGVIFDPLTGNLNKLKLSPWKRSAEEKIICRYIFWGINWQEWETEKTSKKMAVIKGEKIRPKLVKSWVWFLKTLSELKIKSRLDSDLKSSLLVDEVLENLLGWFFARQRQLFTSRSLRGQF